jgi:hypothetical protein
MGFADAFNDVMMLCTCPSGEIGYPGVAPNRGIMNRIIDK